VTGNGATVERASALRVLGTSVGLLALLGLCFFLVQGLFARPIDGAAKVREYFGDAPPPFGLVLSEAVRLPTRDVLVRFAREASGDAPGTGPIEASFLEYRSRSGAEAAFRGGGEEGPPGARLKEWERDKSFAWRATLKRDEIAWGEWRSKLWIERSFREGGGWQDAARVDLSRPDHPLVLYVLWPLETQADEKQLQELLLAVRVGAPASAEKDG